MPRPSAIFRRLARAVGALLVLLLPLAAGGCEAAIAVPASITLRYQEQAPLTRDRLVVTVDDVRSGWYFEGVDFEPEADGWLASRSLRVSASEGVRVRVSLRGASTVAAAAGEIMLPADATAQWVVDVFASELAPEVACGGCTGLARFTIAEADRPAARDWLYVRWTGGGSSLTGPP